MLAKIRFGRTRSASRWRLVACTVLVAGMACDEDGPTIPPEPALPSSEAELVAALQGAYRLRDIDRFESLFHPGFVFTETGLDSVTICRERWICLHQALFARDPAVPQDLWLERVQVTIALAGAFIEQPTPNGLDPARWRVTAATGAVSILLETQGETDYQVTGEAVFVVAEDVEAADGEPRFVFFAIETWANIRRGVEARAWSAVLELYGAHCAECPDLCTIAPCSPEAAIQFLAGAYQQRDPARFSALLHPEFRFILRPDPLNPTQPTDWDRAEEARIHARMFRPDEAVEDPVPEELWLAAITITLTPASAFTERPEYYRSGSNPDGLDPARYRALGVECSHWVLFETQGETDYQTIGRQWFVLAENLDAPAGDSAKLLLYRWQDLGDGGSTARASKSWSNLKALYR